MASKPLPPKPIGAKWTDAQWAGVATTGRSLLVSAAAGSGKTAVLAERCAFLVCDADPPCDVDELLVVTFTEAAAAEMKGRIGRALRDRIRDVSDARRDGADSRLQRQLALIDRAQVSTLHGFCSRLIRQNFHLLDLDPAFIVLDGDEAKLLRAEVARDLFLELHESPDALRFQALVDAYGDGDDERLIGRVIQTHELLGSLVDPQDWLAVARARLAEPASVSFRETQLGKELEAEIDTGLREQHQSCLRALAAVSAMKGFGKYAADLRDCERIVAHWTDVLKSDGIDALSGEVGVELPRLPSVPESTPGKKIAKALVDGVRDQIKGGALRKILAFSTQQWIDGLAEIRPHAQMFLDAVERFSAKYRAAKDALRGIDFSDLERFALKALRKADSKSLAPSAVARVMRRQFAHVLVDEYQDINEVQDAILSLVSRDGSVDATGGNLFSVGDVKQSIYRFRLAEPARFLERQARFRAAAQSIAHPAGERPGGEHQAGEVIDLQANFRSRAPLLTTLNGVFQRLMTKAAADIEYDASHFLHPGLNYPAGDASCFSGSPIELHVLPAKLDEEESAEPAASESSADADLTPPDRAEREAILITRRIHELVDGTESAPPMRVVERGEGDALEPRPIRYSDIVILLRSMRHKGEDYAEVLRRSGIPVHAESGAGYFDSMEVNDLLSLLNVLDNRAQDIPLAAVLRSPLAGLPEPEDCLARIRLAYPDKSIPFHRAVVRYAKEQDDALAAKLSDMLRELDRWRTLAHQRPLAELIWDVYDSTGYLAFCAGLAGGEQRKANLIDLHDRARQFGSFQRQGLSRFLAFLGSLREESDLGQPPVVGEGDNVVRLMTIHHSKGLEFPVVILPDLGKKINLQDCAGSILIDRRAYLGMEVMDEQRQVRYPSLAQTLVSNRLRRQSMAEELRVLYVAMTRAKEHLICVGTCKEDAPETWEARWTGHTGALPVESVVGARCMLDWLGPVTAAMRTKGETPIEVIRHSSDEVKQWPTPQSLRPLEGARQQRLADLAPLPFGSSALAKPAPPDALAAEIIARLDTGYSFKRLTSLAAVEAATTLVKPDRPFPFAFRPTPAGPQSGVRLTLPRAVQSAQKPSAAEIGEATHLLLQHVDFSRACDEDDLRRQLDSLVTRKLLSVSDADCVDLESIHWLAGTEVGTLLREHYASLRRELPIYLALRPEEFDAEIKSTDPRDRVMVRSRLDALLTTTAGPVVLDYKTDRVANVDLYRPQMKLYRRAVELIAGQPLAAVYLVFLNARVIERL